MPSANLICTWMLPLLAIAYAAPGPFTPRQASTCPTVHIIATRGTFEPDLTLPGQVPDVEGFIGQLASAIKARVPGSDSNGTLYPANVSPYNESEATGVTRLTQDIQAYVARCPSTPLVLLGYSQGAQVVANTLCGGADNTPAPFGPTPNSTALDFARYGSHVRAIVTWGNPTHMPNRTYNRGTSVDEPGMFGRLNVEDCEPYAPVWADYCAEGDLVCQKNGTHGEAHLSYPFTDVDAGADFTVDLLQKDGVTVSPASSSSSALLF